MSDDKNELYRLGKMYEEQGRDDLAITYYSRLYSLLEFDSTCIYKESKDGYDALVKYARAGNSNARKVLESISSTGDVPTTIILSDILSSIDKKRSIEVLGEVFNHKEGYEELRTEITLKLLDLAVSGDAVAQRVLHDAAKKNRIVAWLVG